MLKKTIGYIDFDNKQCEETLYFNLTKTEIASNLDLKDQVEEIQKSFQGEPRTLETHEVKALLELLKRLIRLSYGVRSADGKRFSKPPELWTEFTETAVYDQLLFSMFDPPENAFAFILGIMPQDIRAEAEAMVQTNVNQPTFSDADSDLPPSPAPISAPAPSAEPQIPDRITTLLSDTTDGMREIQDVKLHSVSIAPDGLGEIIAVDPQKLGNHGQEDTRPPWIRENREPTKAELQSMTRDELQDAMVRKLQSEA